MNVGILLVTHPGIGQALVGCARIICGDADQRLGVIEVAPDADLEQSAEGIRAAVDLLDNGAGVLTLTDLCGATPHNLALEVAAAHGPVVTGVNLPMLLRAMNYRHESALTLAERAREGGLRGISAAGGSC